MKRSFLAALALLGSACDLVAEEGQTLELGNRGSVFGTGGNAQATPRAAVRVNPGGAVIVHDADVLGGGFIVEERDQPVSRAAPGIIAGGGTVRVVQGQVQGGPIVLHPEADGSVFEGPGAGIDALGTDIEISGGAISGGGIVTLAPGSFASGRPGAGLRALASRIRVTGGTFSAGALTPQHPSQVGVVFSAFDAISSFTEIRGGQFNRSLGFFDGTARIFGGRAFNLTFRNQLAESCSELHGGSFQVMEVSGGQVMIFGTGLALTPLGAPFFRLTGTLEDGTVADIRVAEFGDGQVVLLPSGSRGCPLSS